MMMYIAIQMNDEFLSEAEKRFTSAAVEFETAGHVLHSARSNKAWQQLQKAEIELGDTVTIDFSDGRIDAVYDGIERNTWNGTTEIQYREITSKGKPGKTKWNTCWTMAKHMTKKKEPITQSTETE